MSAQLSDSHRRFLQTLMVQGIMSDGRAKSLHRFCCQTHKAHYDPENLDHFIQAINARLQPMSLQIRKGMSEDDGLQHYALVNLVETTVTRLSSDYADNELELFRKILSDMSENEGSLLEFFVTLPQLKQIADDKEDLLANIVSLAKNNLQMEPRLEGKRQEMLFKYEQLMQMKATFESKMQRQHELSESCSLSTLQARLKVAAHQAEEESEETAENFLEGQADIDEFLSGFMDKRTLCHSRRAKEEKLQQSINSYEQFSSAH